jgi:EAL domain-containing protein (putative c-di-GMP-specific phosphodiesterase class I)
VMIRAEGCDPSRITLEMTESATMAPRPGLEEQLAILAAHGVSLAIDDFGTGHSSLGRLGDFPAGMLKIDRSFVRGLPDGRAARTLVKAIMDLAEGFHMTVVAEGVETEAQRDFLLAAGCDHAQGYLFSPPVSAAEVAGLWPPVRASSSGTLDAVAS